MRRPLLLSFALLLLGGCHPEAPPAPSDARTGPSSAARETGTVDHLRRLYREARTGATPSRDSLVELLGLDPAAARQPPLSSSRPAVADGELTIEPLVYHAAPRIPVSALLWRPPGTGPFPAVPMTHGHFEGGKHAAAVQARCRDLASAGVLVLAIDLFGHGERSSLGHGNAAELYLAGTSLLALDVQSVVRGLDWLQAREDVDASRLGLSGQSGGAIVAIHAGAIDERVAATFANSGLHDWERAVLTTPQCACNYAPNQLRLGTVADAAALIAPRRVLACHGRDDPYIPLASARMAQLHQRYSLLQRDGGHEFNEAARQGQLRFFGESFSLTTAEALAAGSTHQEAEISAFGPQGPPLDALSLSAIAAERQRHLLPATPLPPEPLRKRLRAVLALPPPAPAASLSKDGTRLSLETEPGLILEARVVTGSRKNPPIALLLGSAGSARSLHAEQVKQLREDGFRLIVADLRGQGARADPELDYLQLHVGQAANRPLLGGRVHDALGWIAAAHAMAGEAPISVIGQDEAALVVLLAEVLGDPSNRQVTRLQGAVLSMLADAAGDPAWRIPLSYCVAGLAGVGDVIDFARARQGPRLVWRRSDGGYRRDGRLVTANDELWQRLERAAGSVR